MFVSPAFYCVYSQVTLLAFYWNSIYSRDEWNWSFSCMLLYLLRLSHVDIFSLYFSCCSTAVPTKVSWCWHLCRKPGRWYAGIYARTFCDYVSSTCLEFIYSFSYFNKIRNEQSRLNRDVSYLLWFLRAYLM